MNYVKRTDYFDVYIEPNRNTIVVRSRWKYNWYRTSKRVTNWTYDERKKWHYKADSVIWNQWGGKYTLWALVEKETKVNKHLHRKEFNVEFDIQWVTKNQHWTANVFKVTDKEIKDFPSQVDLSEKTIQFCYVDVKRRIDGDINQNTVKHEFGHTIGLSDEYSEKYGNTRFSVYEKDTKALMNIGNELRKRYLNKVKEVVETMIDGVVFHSFLD